MSVEVQQIRRFNSMERRPRMLKDFLSEINEPSSCSSSGFKSLPRTTIPNGVVTQYSTNQHSKSTLQTLINTIRSISFFTMRKPPSISNSMLSLPRSLSRKLSSSRRSRRKRSQTCNCDQGVSSEIKIRDIIRWKSFRDLQQPCSVPSPPLSPSDFHLYTTESSTTTTTVTTTTTTCSSSSNSSSCSSWCDGDYFFTASWEAQNDSVEAGKKFPFSPLVVGKDSVVAVAPYAALVGSEEDLTCQEEDEQHSPVSVLQVGEDEFSPFDQSLANINERRKQKFRQTIQKFECLAKFDLANLDHCLSLDENSYCDEEYEEEEEEEDQEIEEQDWVEEKAKELLHCVKATSSSVQGGDDYLGTVLLDFFSEELTAKYRNQNGNDEGFEWEILRTAEDWINGSFDYDIVHVNKDDYIKHMDRRGGWISRFEEEKEELALEIEAAILHSLLSELL